MADGTFPKGVRISKRCVGWDSRLVYEWIDAVLAGGAA